MIKLEKVTFRYRPEIRPALLNVSVKIGPGESVCVMGANGSGKSTFAKLLAGLLNPSEGSFTLSQANPTPIPVGMIFQNPDNQMVAVTVEKELAFALENLGCRQEEMERLVNESLEKFHIDHLRRRLTTELSGGEKQRVALASVMIFQPDILVLDEPDSFLDQQGKAALRDELERIRAIKPNMIQIHITQYISVARQYDRLLVFHEGEIKADGAPDAILADVALCHQTGLMFTAADRRKEIAPAYDTAVGIAQGRRLSAVRFENISFRYPGGDFIIRKLSGELKAGEVVGVIGFSGSGKSTLGSLACNLLKPTEGEIDLVGLKGEPLEPRAVPGKVTGVLQQPERQFFLPTCLEEITFGPRNLGQYIDRSRIKSLFELVGLATERFYDRDPFNLSGGEKRRLAFAAVLSMSPDFVVFDEPTCSLDPEGVGRFILLAEALRNSGVGLMVISHDGDVIKALADKIICLKDNAEYEIVPAGQFFAAPEYYRLVSPVSPRPDADD